MNFESCLVIFVTTHRLKIEKKIFELLPVIVWCHENMKITIQLSYGFIYKYVHVTPSMHIIMHIV